MEPTICENCGRVIGALETPCVFEEHVVCAACYAILDAAAPTLEPIAETHRPLAYESPPQYEQRPYEPQLRKYVDHLFWARMILLALFLFAGMVGMTELAWVMLACWLLLGLANLVMKAAHKQRG